MNENFLNKFHNLLTLNEFSPKAFGDFTYFIKTLSSNLYIIAPHTCETTNLEILNSYKNQLKYNFNQIFLIDIIITDNLDENLIKKMDFNSDFEKSFVTVKWIIDTKNKEIVVKGNQPTKILNISNIINECFNNEVYEKIVKNKNKSYVKSKNTNLTFSLILILVFIHLILINKNILKEAILIGGVSTDGVFVSKEFYRIFTSIFLHLNLTHLVSNCLSLYIFGSRVEKYMGKSNFLIIYLISGLSSSFFSSLFNSNLSIGASGSIFGLSSAILYYSIKFNKNVDGFDYIFLLTFSCINILFGFFSKNVDNIGHIAGFLTGLLISFFALKKYKSNP